MKYSLFKNISFTAFLLVAFSACGPDNLDMTDLDKDENDPDVVICNMTVTIEESNQSPAHLNSVVEDGTPPYTYLWSTGDTTPIIGLNANGLYSLEVTDSEGCVATDSIEIGAPCFGLSVMLAEQPPGSGMLYSAVTGGSGNYTYEWSTGETTANINVSVDGNYTLLVTDSEGCVVTGIIEVGNNNDPCLGLFMILAEQPPGSGNLYSSVTGGTAPYTYTWGPNGESTQDIVATSSGWYSCSILDNLGCLLVDTVYVVLDNPCNQFDGIISETPAGSGILEASILFGGTPPFSYLWSTGETTNVIVAPENGFYEVTITDSEGCVYQAGYNVTLGADPCSMFNVVLAEQPPGSGAIYSQVIGGTAPFSYLWSTMETTPNIEVNSVGQYVLTVTDDEGCITSTTIEI